MKLIEDIRAELRAHIGRKYKKQAAAAQAWGVSSAFVSSVLSGRKEPNETMLDDAGFERLTTKPQYIKRQQKKEKA